MSELLHAAEPQVAAPSRPAMQPTQRQPQHDPFADAQRGVGNQGLQQLLRSVGAQAKLTISEPGDPLEEEADRVADDVLRMDDASGAPVLRLCEECEDEDRLQRQAAPKEEEKDEEKLRVQPKADAAPPAVSPQISDGISAARAGGVPLPTSERSFFEPRFGRDLGDVRLHTDASAARSAGSVNAHAYTVGSDVVFAPGQYAPRTAQGRRLLAHELAHVAQQQPSGGVARSSELVARQAATATAPAATPATPTTVTTPTPATPGTVAAPQNRAETPPVPPGVPVEEVTLQAPTFTPPATVDSYLEERGNAGGIVRARFGNIAAGTINVRKRGTSYETHGGRYSSIPLVHPALADLAGTPAQPVLAVRIEDSKIEGFVSLAALERRAPQRDALLNFIEEHPEAMRWVGLTDLRFPAVTNKLEGGNLQLRVNNFSFKVGGYLRGTGTFGLENESVVFNARAHISVRRLAEADLEIERDVAGGIKGRVEIPVRIEKFQGNLIAAFENGTVDIQGRVRYTTKKLAGEVTLLVTDEETARNVARRRLPPDQIRGTAQEAAAPAGAPALARPGPRALAGWGDLDFHFTPWLTGKATVIIDSEGHVTVVGEIAPPLRIELFPQKDFVKRIFTLEARALYGVPVVGNIFVFANVGIDALAKFGPGTLYNMRIEGTYSTDPAVLDRFSISATMNISAFAGLRLRGEGGAGIEILEHDIKAGVGVWALAGIRGYVEATPTIGYRELAEPVAGEEGQFYIHGHMELAAQPFLGLGGDLFVELDSPWWSPAPDKKWTWPLGQLEYPLPGAFGIGADVDYVIGSEELPEIQFTDVDFNAQKFMTDLMNDKVPPAEVPPEQEQPGQWNEGEAPADAAATQPEPGATDTEGAPPAGEVAQGQGGEAAPTAADQTAVPPEQPTPELVKGGALGDVEQRLSGLGSVGELDNVIRSVYGKYSSKGLQSLDIDVVDEETMDLEVSAEASEPERRTIRWADAFAPDDEIRALFERAPRYETNAAISINGSRFGEVVASDRQGHAEQNLLRAHWGGVLDAVRQNADKGIHSQVVLAINRAPCHTICTPELIDAMSQVTATLRDNADFILAPTGVYEPTENLADEDVQEAEERYHEVADRLRAASREVEGYTVLSRAELTPHTTRMSDLDDLAAAGWDIRQLAVRPRETSAGVVLAEAAHKVAVRAGRVHSGS